MIYFRPKQILRWRAFSALRHRNYRIFWLSGVGQISGQGMLQLSMAWLVLTQPEGSVSLLGVMVFLQGLPMMVIMTFGGVFADRWNRRHIMLVGQTIMIINITALGLLHTAGWLEMWHIYLTAALTGSVQGMTNPARAALVRQLVDREDLMNAVTLNATLMNGTRVVAPTFAGVFIDSAGIGAALFVTAGAYAVGVTLIAMLKGITAVSRLELSSPTRDFVEGLKYVIHTPVMLALVVLGLSMGFLGMSYIQLAPAFGREVLDVGASEVGLLMFAAGLGALIGNVILIALGDVKHQSLIALGLLLLLPPALVGLAVVPSFSAALVALFFVGAASGTYISMTNVLTQIIVPVELLGRVTSLMMLGASMMFIGALPLGVLGDAVGLRWSFFTAAMLLLAITLVIGVLWPPIRKART